MLKNSRHKLSKFKIVNANTVALFSFTIITVFSISTTYICIWANSATDRQTAEFKGPWIHRGRGEGVKKKTVQACKASSSKYR